MATKRRSKKGAERKPYAEEVSQKMIAMLKAGTAPWQRPWKPGVLSLPFNAVTGKPYHGMNTLWLEIQGRSDPRWLTYRQAQSVGAQVKKGEQGTGIRYWKLHDERVLKDRNGKPILDEAGKKKTVKVELDRPRAFFATVFNAEQVDGLPSLEAEPGTLEPERHARAEAILERSGASIRHVPGNSAYYSPPLDRITLPERHQFETPDGYYATALHELGHWTGHESRLNRDLSGPFGSEKYAREELRAEIASLMLGDQLGIGHDPGQHASYVGHWVKVLEEDHNEIFRAAADAEKIASYVLGFEQEQTLETTQQIQPEETPEMARHRTWLDVPFDEKEQAKTQGAKWDWSRKQWYAPANVDLAASGLWQWLPQQPVPVEEAFREAAEELGLVIDGPIEGDGKIHRVPVTDDRPGQKSGAYALHLQDMFPGGYIQNFRTGEQLNWKEDKPRPALTPEERQTLAKEIEAKRQARLAEERQRHAETAKAARILWAAASPAPTDHPYAKAKDMRDPAANGLRVVPASVPESTKSESVRIAQTPQDIAELQKQHRHAHVFLADSLLVPMVDTEGALWGLQSITEDSKHFMRGSRKAGLFSVAGAKTEDLTDALKQDPAKQLIIAEGYATADTVSRLMEQPVVVAFDAGNLADVAASLRQQWPDRELLIAADNDHLKAGEMLPNGKPRPNVGLEKAEEAARLHKGQLLTPPFARGERGSDWNDYARLHGDGAPTLDL